MYLRQIQKETQLPLRSVQIELSKLEILKILKSEINGKNKYFTFNKTNILTFYEIFQSSIHSTIEFIEYNKNMKALIEEIMNKDLFCVLFFGSVLNPKIKNKGDIDILIINNKQSIIPDHLSSTKMHIIQMTKQEFKKNVKLKTVLIEEIFKKNIIIKNHTFIMHYVWRWLT